MKNKTILRIIAVTALFLLIPLYGNRYIEGWNWSGFDFIFATIMIGGVQLAYEYLSKKSGGSYKLATGLMLAGTFLLIWINGAVGIIGDEDNGVNMMYIAVLATLFIGSFISKYKAAGMMRTLYVAAGIQMLVPVIALLFAPAELVKTPGIVGVFLLNAVFAMIFATSGRLFEKAHKFSS